MTGFATPSAKKCLPDCLDQGCLSQSALLTHLIASHFSPRGSKHLQRCSGCERDIYNPTDFCKTLLFAPSVPKSRWEPCPFILRCLSYLCFGNAFSRGMGRTFVGFPFLPWCSGVSFSPDSPLFPLFGWNCVHLFPTELMEEPRHPLMLHHSEPLFCRTGNPSDC